MRTATWTARQVLLLGAMTLAAGCSSTSSGGGSGGKGGSGTGGSGTGGAHTGGSGGAGTGGAAGGGGAAGSAGGAGAGGVAGAGCTAGAPPVTPHNTCTTIPGPGVPAAGGAGGAAGAAGAAGLGAAGGAGGHAGAGGFKITSPDFAFCGTIPAASTCDGHDFGTGTNPNLMWSGAPSGTMSYAMVFKDISLLGDTSPGTPNSDINVQHGYHWVMWDIPSTVTSLASGATNGYHSPTVTGAMQWSQRNNYGFFPPCPNPFPRGDARFNCALTLDSYSFTIYAFAFSHLPALPTPDLNANGEPTGNYVVNIARVLESLTPLAVAEYRGTSSAWASSFAPPSGVEYPCAADDKIDGGTNQKDGGITIDGSALMCLQ